MNEIREQIHLDYTLTFRSAFHFGTGLRSGLIHRSVARDRDEYLYVPGSTIKGVLRHRCEQIATLFGLKANEPHDEANARLEANIQNPDIIIRIFGSRFLPSQLYFDDALILETDRKGYFDSPTMLGKYKARQVEERTQVSLLRRTRTAKSGQLYTSEYGIRQLRFKGRIYGHIEGLIEPDMPSSYALLLLLAGLTSLNQLGANKSTGAGQVSCKVDEPFQLNERNTQLDEILNHLPFLEYYQLSREEER